METQPRPLAHVHEDIVHRVNEIMPCEEELFDLSELFKIFGDSTRIRILYVLFESEMCVCGIADDPVGHIPSAAGAEEGEAGAVQKGGEDDILLPGG